MKVRATVSFAGPDISMAMGEERDVREGIASPLIECGYLVKVKEEKKPATGKKGAKASENTRSRTR